MELRQHRHLYSTRQLLIILILNSSQAIRLLY